MAALRHDGALVRLSNITAAIGVAIVVAVGALGVYVGRALPGHHATSTTGASAPNSGVPAGNSGNSGNSGQGGINPPSSAPQGASLPAPVTSGSS